MWTDNENLRLIDVRTKMDDFFQLSPDNTDYWEEVIVEADLPYNVASTMKQWQNLLLKYKEIYRLLINDDSESTPNWPYFDVIHKWAEMKSNFDEWINSNDIEIKTNSHQIIIEEDNLYETIDYDCFNSICRFCGTNQLNLIPIFNNISSDGDDSINIPESISILTNLSINENDDFPQNICKSCYDKMKEFLKFRENCQNTFEVLKNIKKMKYSIDMVFLNDENLIDHSKVEDVVDEMIKNEIDDEKIVNEEFDDEIIKDEIDDEEIVNDIYEESNFNSNLSSSDSIKIEYLKEESSIEIEEELVNENFKELETNVEEKIINNIDETKLSECQLCGKFVTSLRRHMNSHLRSPMNKSMKKNEQKKSPAPQQCQVCGRVVKKLTLHLRTHTRQNCAECKYCHKLFTQKSALKEHYRIHENKKIHKCEICNELFVHRLSMRLHRATHTNERRFICDICGKGFILNEGLRRHKLIHSERKRNCICSICEKGFLDQSALRKHLTLHGIIESPPLYSCELCKKEFRFKGVLDNHIKLGKCKIYNDKSEKENSNNINEAEIEYLII